MPFQNSAPYPVLKAEFVGLDYHDDDEDVISLKIFKVRFVENFKCDSFYQSSIFCVSTLKASDNFTKVGRITNKIKYFSLD